MNVLMEKGGDGLEDNREEIMRGAIEGVAEYGLEGLNMKTISRLSGRNSSTIYTIFNSKDELLRCCFERIDHQIARLFGKVKLDPRALAEDPEGQVRRIWTRYFRFLVEHPAETLFYVRYRSGSGFAEYDKKRDVSHFAGFMRLVRTFDEQYHIFRDIPSGLLWLHLLTTTLMYARYVVEGVLPRDADTQERIFQLEMNGLRSLMAADAAGGHGDQLAKGGDPDADSGSKPAGQGKPA